MRLDLNSGGVIEFDDDDAWIAERCWRLWRYRERQSWIVVTDVAENCRRIRLKLHREVAFRMRPDLARRPDLLKVLPKNGNYLDVRRANLELLVQKAGRGRPRARPSGYRYLDPRTPTAGHALD